ncbi:integral membrane protein [Paracoccidioides lutzii Pb01]|uniref:Integral membrane protein n=1 Tax=Paracoccidioides lutzii (strain ATCC MYA-826 / Pb01) TaxID=502779 RepID=C1H9T4_PARBA|nr:integral membrane protein [Paracoccidioides lutzii Pb01]EEH37107.1 integral membrane protein [Paracoccidioides lutzii Pb01]
MHSAFQTVPLNYQTPPFPSLYISAGLYHQGAKYLYYTGDIWRFTLFWTLLFYIGIHLSTSLCAAVMQWRNWKLIWAAPLVYILVASLEALLAGSVVGLILGAVYEAGNYHMSTWIPFSWAATNTLVLILSSFSVRGGLWLGT